MRLPRFRLRTLMLVVAAVAVAVALAAINFYLQARCFRQLASVHAHLAH
jgi:hypothetical protein